MIHLSDTAARRPKVFMWMSGLLSALLIVLVVLPTLWPGSFGLLQPLRIDTDPENMLSEDEPVRVFHNRQKKDFALYDMVVVGVVNEDHPEGVFNQKSLNDIHALTEYAKSIQWQDEKGETQGVISVDLMAPSTVDNIEPGGPGVVKFEWLMKTPPLNEAEALANRAKAQNIPLLNGTIVSDDGKAVALYMPITAKNVSYNVVEKLKSKIAEFDGNDQYHITGLPVAQDTFGVEMFVQMAISAPLAMLLIFLLMWYFFKKVSLVVSPMIVAMVSVIGTMGLLVITGNTVHIMSSMIPIFIMPIAVLDAIHILSDFYDRYPQYRDRKQTLKHVMQELSKPMLFTTLTTAVGFGSLALTPIPPVQVFGVFVAIGVVMAWFFTITLIPAYIMLMPEERFADFGLDHSESDNNSLMARFLSSLGRLTYSGAKVIMILVFLLVGVAWVGVTKIVINDNPVKWFAPDHEIRVADRALNERFAGTYMAYLVLTGDQKELGLAGFSEKLIQDMTTSNLAPLQQLAPEVAGQTGQATDKEQLMSLLVQKVEDRLDKASDTDYDAWDKALSWVEGYLGRAETFKNPDVLRYMAGLQAYLQERGLVGKSNSLADVVKTVHRELFQGDPQAFRIPDSRGAVAETLITYQNSHRPQDLWHFVTPDYKKSNMWLQLKSGDNRDMAAVVDQVDRYFQDHPAPQGLTHDWFGLTYINVIWQDKMVSGMAEAFVGSFAIVLLMMTVLFRSLWWGILAMIPLAFTIGMIYGIIGLIGKDYDMPVAVLSALSLGLAVDYAIHFLARSREMRKKYPDWQTTAQAVFGEPARAITRNVIVVGVGFMPLLLAPLVPYQTVGVFISAILVLAGVASLTILPALIRIFESILFKEQKEKEVA
ncbi:efflux RND transporter permease subunit [Paremcibacter congregatus]|uniref:RND transporter n=1 Tax=Paremcibacter congregatus TaxID=2043170 RepID=A0A2G4YMA0_9PROT|nr:MMPL family transporter [Paremcibacter congregatus]PHZ83450.1 RND transporter [Paremcibacter congregatus]QDE28083.1 RND transporter [Paremcibacter congregatus]